MMTLEVRDDIKFIVRRLGKSLSDLSRTLDMNYDSLNHYLNGRRKMKPELAEKIEKVLSEWEHGI